MEEIPWPVVLGDRQDAVIPPPIHPLYYACLCAIELRALDLVGIFRVPGSARQVATLKEHYLKRHKKGDPPPDFTGEEPFTICSLLTDYLRTSEEPLLTFDLADRWLAVAGVADWITRTERLMELLHLLPLTNYAELFLLLRLLVLVNEHADKNKMPINNLATIFGPMIVRRRSTNPAEELRDVPRVVKLCMELLKMYHQLFNLPEPNVNRIAESEPGDRRNQRRHGLNMGQNGERRRIAAFKTEDTDGEDEPVNNVNKAEPAQPTLQVQPSPARVQDENHKPNVAFGKQEPRERKTSVVTSGQGDSLRQLSQMGQFYLKVDSRSLVRSLAESGGEERAADLDYMRSIVSAGGIRLDLEPDSTQGSSTPPIPTSGTKPAREGGSKIRAYSGPLVSNKNRRSKSGSARTAFPVPESPSKSSRYMPNSAKPSSSPPPLPSITLHSDDDDTVSIHSDTDDSIPDAETLSPSPSPISTTPSSPSRQVKVTSFKRRSTSLPDLKIDKKRLLEQDERADASQEENEPNRDTGTKQTAQLSGEALREHLIQKKQELERRRKELEQKRLEIRSQLEAEEAATSPELEDTLSLHSKRFKVQNEPPLDEGHNAHIGGKDHDRATEAPRNGVIRKWKLRQRRVQQETRDLHFRRRSRSARDGPKTNTSDDEADENNTDEADTSERTAERASMMAILERYYGICGPSEPAFPGIKMHTELAAPPEIEQTYPEAMRKQRARIEQQWTQEQVIKMKKRKPTAGLSTISSWQIEQLKKLKDQEEQLGREEEGLEGEEDSASKIIRQRIRVKREEVQRRIREVELDIEEQEQARQSAREAKLAALHAANTCPVPLHSPTKPIAPDTLSGPSSPSSSPSFPNGDHRLP